MRVTSLGFQTDVALRVMEGAEVTDRGARTLVIVADQPQATRVYRACGFTHQESQLSFERPST